MFTTKGAKILDGTPNYLVIEEVGEIDSVKYFEEVLYEMKKYIKEKEIQSVSIVLNEKEAGYTQYTSLLEEFSYQNKKLNTFTNVNLLLSKF
ncbi:hypothetical protein Plano_1426 [Planococcus sp. PAMC 21323]|uniref:hypothetical protein n=1 Tax=Planococcus sp. PAMC 21323 TaxID=1526927 RepID=UPI00056E1D80|nr:hypothetical protein [Planococcus sp. PAMC 21323]AIY05391.1 hypothetical protein Plano_1426 [Planococcus sp. PAMC 21323]